MTARAPEVKLLQAATQGVFGYSLKQITAACLLSGLIAGTITALTSESAADKGVIVPTFTVNRMNKTDRFPGPFDAQLPLHHFGSPMKRRATTRIPEGCERAFSPIVHPALANIVKLCLT